MSSSSSMFRYVLILWLIFYKLPVLFPQFSISVRLSLYLFVIEMIFHSTCSCFHTYFSNSINNCETHNWNCQPFEQWIEEMDIGQCNAKWTKKKEKTNRNTLLVIWTCIVPQFIIFFSIQCSALLIQFFFCVSFDLNKCCCWLGIRMLHLFGTFRIALSFEFGGILSIVGCEYVIWTQRIRNNGSAFLFCISFIEILNGAIWFSEYTLLCDYYPSFAFDLNASH